MVPMAGSLLHGPGAHHPHLVCHCLLVELPDRLVLVDSGFGLADIAAPKQRLGSMFVGLVRPTLEPTRTAAAQIEALGFRDTDVRDIIVTHMDVDHIGGLADFPHANVHVARAELERATSPATLHDRLRYRPTQWSHGPRFRPHDASGEPWFGFPAVRDLQGLPPELLVIPLVGHSMGHVGVAIDTGATEGHRWLLHCGDAYFHRGEVDPEQPRCPRLLRGFERMVAADDGLRRANQARLRRLFAEASPEVRLFCAHDSQEFARQTA